MSKELAEQAVRELMEAKKAGGAPINAILNAVKRSKAAKAARAAKMPKPETPEEPQEPLIVMDVDELMAAMENGEIELADVDESITATEVITKELENWGIKPGSLGYKTIFSVIEDFSAEKLGYKPTSEEIVENAANRFKTKKTSVVAALAQLIKKAKFENSSFMPMLAKIPRDQITWEIVLNEVADFAE